MRKKLLSVFSATVMALMCFWLAACGGKKAAGAETGTYYLYEKNDYNENDYIMLESGIWTSCSVDADTTKSIVGSYTVDGSNLTVSTTVENVTTSVTAKYGNGVIFFPSTGEYYCMRGKTPNDMNIGGGTPDAALETALDPVYLYYKNDDGTYTVTGVQDKTATAYNIPEGVSEIADNAFLLCEKATAITLPKSIKVIGDYAFSKCRALMTVTVPDCDRLGRSAFGDCTALTAVTVGSVAEIDYNTFIGCTGITKATLNDGTTALGRGMFFGCDSMTEVRLPATLETISDNAFGLCEKLAYINIPDSVTEIKEDAFTCCFELNTVIIGSGVKTIEKDAFFGARRITTVKYRGNAAGWAAISIADGNDFLKSAARQYI